MLAIILCIVVPALYLLYTYLKKQQRDRPIPVKNEPVKEEKPKPLPQ